MQNKYYDSITTLGHFILTILVITIFIMTKSNYLIAFSILLPIYLILLNYNSINRFLNVLKNYSIIYIIAFIIYILVIRHITLFIIIKYLVIILLINNFIYRLSFKKVNSMFYKLLILFPNRDILSYKITLKLYYINKLFMSRDEIAKFQSERGERKYGIRYGLLARREYASYKTDNLDNNLKTNFYKINVERCNFITLFLIMLFILVLVLVIIRK